MKGLQSSELCHQGSVWVAAGKLTLKVPTKSKVSENSAIKKKKKLLYLRLYDLVILYLHNQPFTVQNICLLMLIHVITKETC